MFLQGICESILYVVPNKRAFIFIIVRVNVCVTFFSHVKPTKISENSKFCSAAVKAAATVIFSNFHFWKFLIITID